MERLVVRSNCLNIVDCINDLIHFVVIEHIALDGRVLLSNFRTASVMFLPRLCKTEAHKLVGVGFALGSRTWLGNSPSWNVVVTMPLAAS